MYKNYDKYLGNSKLQSCCILHYSPDYVSYRVLLYKTRKLALVILYEAKDYHEKERVHKGCTNYRDKNPGKFNAAS